MEQHINKNLITHCYIYDEKVSNYKWLPAVKINGIWKQLFKEIVHEEGFYKNGVYDTWQMFDPKDHWNGAYITKDDYLTILNFNFDLKQNKKYRGGYEDDSIPHSTV